MKVTIEVRIGDRFYPAVWTKPEIQLKQGYAVVDGLERYTEGVTYYLRYRRAGERKREKASKDAYDTLTLRDTVLAKLVAEDNGLTVVDEAKADPNRRTLQGAVAAYIQEVTLHRARHTATGYAATLNQFIASTRRRFLDEIGRDEVLNFMTYLRGITPKYSDRTVYNKTENVVTFLKAQGVPSPLRKNDWPTYETKKATIFSNSEIVRLRQAAAAEDKVSQSPYVKDEQDILEVYLGTGFRKGEIENLRWADVDTNNRLIRVRKTTDTHGDWQTKDKEQRVIPIHPQLLALLITRRTEHPDDVFVFQNQDGGGNLHSERIIKRIADRAGVSLKGKRPQHDFRKTWSTRLNRNGVDVVTIKELLGHSSLETTMDYLRAVDPDDEELRDKVAAAVAIPD
jgi:integrase